MPRNRIDLPKTFSFSCTIPVRITDINYGGHVGNDTVLTLIHEARMQFLHNAGLSEMEFGGTGMIMSDVSIEFKAELHYGDQVTTYITLGEITKIGFDVYYKLEKNAPTGTKLVAVAKTGMICFDYSKKKIASVPKDAIGKLQGRS